MKRVGIGVLSCLAVLLFLYASTARPDELATVTGYVTDPGGLRIAGAKVQATNVETNVSYFGESNGEGLFRIGGLPVGSYRIVIQKIGFKTTVKQGLELHVQDIVALNFQLEIGSVAESVTVAAEVPLVNTESAAVSTVVDHEFVENLPINGRGFQTLIALSPGVVLTPANQSDSGQFSVNGQRSSTNYFTVDGVSANVGVQPTPYLSQTAGGSTPGFSVTGGTNNLVSEDALQEFRIQTSTFAPEFGRTPGAQVSIVTRSGTNQFHGAVFEFLRNDKLDANDWFADREKLAKAEERINDFGGVFGGPIVGNRTFFFFSYEGQRLRLPQTVLSTVPSIRLRNDPNTSAGVLPFLNLYPLPLSATPENTDSSGNQTGQTPFSASFSNQYTLNATSFRFDHRLNDRLILFGRYNYAPTEAHERGLGALSNLQNTRVDAETLTMGLTWTPTVVTSNEFRFNYSRVKANNSSRMDNFGGAVPPQDSILFPSPFSSTDSTTGFAIFDMQNGGWSTGKGANNLQRQFNIVDSFSFQKGSHALKFGGDYRRLTPKYDPFSYELVPVFLGLNDLVSENPFEVILEANTGATVLFRNLGLFAQDTWKVMPRLTLTYGLRWDVDFAPKALNGPPLAAVTGFNDLSTMSLAPAGTPIFATTYGNVAPRIGAAFQLRQSQNWETVLRGGFGFFYDLATAQAGDLLQFGNYPYGANETLCSFCPSPAPSFPFNFSDPALRPPPINVASLQSGALGAFDPNLKLPRIYQWNLSVGQSLGAKQALTASYIGAVGRRLIQEELDFANGNPILGFVQLARNAATSDYHSLQLQFQRQMSKGVQVLASYTFSHSIDTASSGSTGGNTNLFVRGDDPNINRGDSDFDIRHSFSGALAYSIPVPRNKGLMRAALGHWSIDNIVQARSAPPVFVLDTNVFRTDGNSAVLRPNLVPGQPLYLYGPQYPGGKSFNRAALTDPGTDASGNQLQGTLGRNVFRGFGAWQWDFAVRREFHIHGKESTRLQFRSEFFNILNHPNFSAPVGDLASPNFGVSTQVLSRGLGGTSAGAGGFNSVFQLGGPRSIQFALKLLF